LPDLTGNLESVDIGQPQVQSDNRRIQLLGRQNPLGPCTGGVHVKSSLCKDDTHETPYVLVVFDYKTYT
jgi:hypothetical protein